MRTALLALVVVTVGCGTPKRDNGTGDATGGPADACVGLQCRIDNCAAMNMPPTRITGTAFAPNGTLPLYDVTVYIPNVDPGTFTPGVQCDRCVVTLPGEPVQYTTSGEDGTWHLDNVPSGSDIPLILTVGKWRRRALIPNIIPCTDNALPAELTSLPKKATDGNEMPMVAISTGGADALECLPYKLGVATSEFTSSSGSGHIHMYTSDPSDPNHFASGGATHIGNDTTHTFAASSTLWNSLDNLKKYDVVLLSCEGDIDTGNKPKTAMDNVKKYADIGGRIFMEHYHHEWIGGDPTNTANTPDVWPAIATFSGDGFADSTDTIDTVSNPKGTSFANWMLNVHGSTTLGSIDITEGRQTCTAVTNKAERWVYTGTEPQIFQFTTPNEAADADRCGKVVFSDMHVANGSTSSSSTGFPMGCSPGDLSPQEKALAFMFFDIASCVQVISKH